MNKVKSYSGSSYPEKPRSLEWEGQQFEVQEIIHRTREPDGLRFIVHCSPGDQIFEIYYHLIDEEWQIQPKGFSKHSPYDTGE